MRRFNLHRVALLLALTCLVMLGSTPTVAQVVTDNPHLGLSAAPDAYVPVVEVERGVPFTLYMIMIGPEEGPLPFDLAETTWGVHTACCGGSAEIIGVDYCADMEHDGNPVTRVHSTMDGCLDHDIVMLAELTFLFHFTQPGAYLLPGGATGPTLDCEGQAHLLHDLAVEVLVSVDSENQSWGSIKAMYR